MKRSGIKRKSPIRAARGTAAKGMLNRGPTKKRRDSGTRSKVSKGPARDAKHLAKVRLENCLFCQRFGPNEAHHIRLGLRTMGVRKSDYLAVPLCNACHRMLHEGKEEHFWNGALTAPGPWIANFSPQGRAALAALQPRREG